MDTGSLLEARKASVGVAGDGPLELACEKASVAGSVSQRACVFCGSRVVLYPVADALHLVHGPIGCAAYTWDIRGSLSSGPQLHRESFSTDMRERDVIFGGEKKLAASLDSLIPVYKPKAAFVYSTCLVGLIGDDLGRICRQASVKWGIPVIPVASEGFKGSKKDGYKAACDSLMKLIGTREPAPLDPKRPRINILGEFNIAGEAWTLRTYYERMGVEIGAILTGDGRVDEISACHGSQLNVVQCSGSMTHLARAMEEKYGIPFIRVSYFGLEDTAEALYEVARRFEHVEGLEARAQAVVRDEVSRVLPALEGYHQDLKGRKAALYVGGAFKAISLVKALRMLGMRTVLAGTQTGNAEDYERLRQVCDPGTILVDDSNPLEMARFLRQTGAEVFIGGVKERPLAYKLGIGFCDHNHERKEALAGFHGMIHFAREVRASVLSPVWKLAREALMKPLEGLSSQIEAIPVPTVAAQAPLEPSVVPAQLSPSVPRTAADTGEPAVNACKLCAPLGASIALRGIEGGMALLHGSQGCATYIRRYLISHFREPVDIASSNFSEASVVYGGAASLRQALSNVQRQYKPSVVGVATTCLAETLGEDLKGQLLERNRLDPDGVPAILVHTPSFKGTHAEGYVAAVRAIAEHFAVEGPATDSFNLFPGFVSPEDLRLLKGLVASFGLDAVLLADYSDSLDGGAWETYLPLSPGGTPLDQLRKLGTSWASLELGSTLAARPTAAAFLEERFGVARQTMPLPIGVTATDALVRCLADLSSREIPDALRKERGRLLDAYADGHKSVFGLRVGVYGEEDLAIGLAAWLAEVGCTPVLVASGGYSGRMEGALTGQIENFGRLGCRVMQGADFNAIREAAKSQGVQLLVGNSKGYPSAKALGIPLLRAGFPVHDRFGGARLLHLGYAGALRLYDSLVNLMLERKQASSGVGYGYL